MTQRSAYRPDIDGLRAVAVLSVLFFHLRSTAFSGGFVGVDVFFVISGYLITGLVDGEIAGRSFSLKRFYLRRVRRLAPALVAMSVAVAVAAFVVVYPEDLRSYASSLALQFVSLQNFVFLAEGEYFRGSETKLLLHTWTLAVEEQFYLLWPLLLLVTSRLRPARRLALVGMLVLCSFGLNLALMRISPKASFFLLPPRAWELGVGGMLALVERQGRLGARLSAPVRIAASAAGLAAIGLAVGLFTEHTAFPGYAAALPVAGAALVIAGGIGGSTPLQRLLSHPAAVHVGLLSYPLYLWHWPLIALCNLLKVDVGRAPVALGVIVGTLVLAELTYRYVEAPVRERRWLASSRSLLATVGAVALVLTAVGIHFRTSRGAAYRYPPVARAMLTAPFDARSDRCGLAFRVLHPREEVCRLVEAPQAGRRVLVWGNSHADMWSGMFIQLARSQGAGLYLNAKNCRPTLDSEFCGAGVNAKVLQSIRAQGVTDVVLASSWYGMYDIPDSVLERRLREVVAALSAAGVRTWLVVDPPSGIELNPVTAYESNPAVPRFGSVPLSRYQPVHEKQRAFFASLGRSYRGVGTVDPVAAYCGGDRCAGGEGAVAWYRDGGHLTDAGAGRARPYFAPVFGRDTTAAVP